jgi:hypothetical protein
MAGSSPSPRRASPPGARGGRCAASGGGARRRGAAGRHRQGAVEGHRWRLVEGYPDRVGRSRGGQAPAPTPAEAPRAGLEPATLRLTARPRESRGRARIPLVRRDALPQLGSGKRGEIDFGPLRSPRVCSGRAHGVTGSRIPSSSSPGWTLSRTVEQTVEEGGPSPLLTFATERAGRGPWRVPAHGVLRSRWEAEPRFSRLRRE